MVEATDLSHELLKAPKGHSIILVHHQEWQRQVWKVWNGAERGRLNQDNVREPAKYDWFAVLSSRQTLTAHALTVPRLGVMYSIGRE